MTKAMPYPEILLESQIRTPNGYWQEYWQEYGQEEHVDYIFSKCDLWKLLCYHASDEIEEYIRQFRIIHLKRRNLLAQFVSGLIANNIPSIGWSCQKQYRGNIYVNPDDLELMIGLYKQKWALYDSYPNVIPVWYEDGLDYNMTTICDAIGIEKPKYKVKTIKVVNTDLSQVVTNYDEVREYDKHFE